MLKNFLPKFIIAFNFLIAALISFEKANAQTITCTNNTAFTTSSTLRNGQTAQTFFGVSMTVSANLTLGTLQFNNSNGSANAYFANGVLKMSTSGTYATAVPVSGTSIAINGSDITVTGFSQSMVTGTTYTFYLVLDCSFQSYATLPSSINFSLSFLKGPGYFPTYTISGSPTSVTYTLAMPDITVTNLTGGLTTGAIVNGQTGIVVFGFSVTVTGALTTNQFAIISANNAQSIFSNAKLYRSTTSSTYPTGFGSSVATGTINSTNTRFTYTETFPGATTTVNYFVTMDYTGTCPTPSTIQFAISSSQSPAFIIGPGYVDYPPTNSISGTSFNVAKTLNWIGGQTGGLWSNLNNFATICGGAPSSISVNDVVQIGVTNAITNQPVLAGATTVGQIIFGKLNTPTLNTAGYALNAGISTATSGAGGNPSITGAGTITMPSGSVSNIVAGTPLTIAGAVTNNTTMAVASGATLTLSSSLTNGATGTVNDDGTITVATASTNAGTINLISAGALTYSNTLANSGTIAQAGTGTFTIAGTLTNTGTISHSGSGNMSLAAITNNSGSITFGGGTNTVSSTLDNASGATVTLGGTTTITGAVTNTGTLNGGAGTTTFSTAFTNSAATGVYNGGSANTTFTNTFTNNNTYVASTGTNDFNNTFTNSGTATFPTGSGTTTMSGAFNNSASSTLTASAGTINFDNAGTQLITNSNASTPVTFNNVTFSNTSVKTLAGTMGFTINGTTTFSGTASLTTTTAPVTNNGTFNSGAVTNTFGAAFTNGATGIFNASTSTTAFNGAFANTGIFNPNTATLTFANSFTNNSGGVFTAIGGNTTFSQGAAQAINNNNTTTPVTFFDMKLSGGAFTKTLGGTGKFEIASTGSIEFTTASTILAAGTALLTLKSDANGSSTVKALLSGNSITGTVNVERYLTGGQSYSRGYRLLSSPVGVTANGIIPNLSYLKNSAYLTGTGGSTNGFDVAGNPTLYFYRENLAPNSTAFTSGNYRGVGKINNTTASSFTIDVDNGPYNLPAGNGFLFFFRGDRATNATTSTTATANAVTLTSTGVLNQGSITVNHWTTGTAGLLNTTVTGNTNVKGYNLVGNPYASSIDWDTFGGTGITGTNVGGTNPKIWIYNPKLKVYATYIKGVGGTNFNTAAPNIIPSGQGFFIRANGASPSLTFNESAKVNTNVTGANLSLSDAMVSTVPRYLRLQLFKDSINSDEALIAFTNAAKERFIGEEDAEYLRGNSLVNLSTRSSDNVSLAINQTAFPTNNQVIPLNVNVTGAGKYELNLSEIKNIPDMFNIWLIDKYKKDSLDILHNPTYSFITSTDTASYGGNRFKLAVRIDPVKVVHLLNFSGIKSNSEVKLSWTVENEANYTRYTLERSIDGGKNFSVLDSLTSANLGTYTDLDPYPAKGQNIYRLKQIDLMGNITYSSIVPIMYADNIVNSIAGNLINVYPNPVTSILNVAITPATNEAANYKITITNSSGIVVKSISSSNTNWQGDVATLSAGTYFIQIINIKNNTVTGKSTFIKL